MSLYPFRDGVQNTYDRIIEWVDSFPENSLVVSFNGLSYDHFVLWRLFDIVMKVGKKGDWLEGRKVQFLDVFYQAQFIDPNLPSYSLASLSRGSASEKIDYRESLIQAGIMRGDEPRGHEFTFYHELMDDYCQADVDATITLAKKQVGEMNDLYKGNWLTPAYKLGQKSFFLMKAQEHSGTGFNLPYALEVQEQLAVDMAELEKSVLPQLPPRPLKKGEEAEYSMPAKPYKKDGTY